MKTPDEIKKGLETCTSFGGCALCPYHEADMHGCVGLEEDAFAYIRQLEAKVEELKKRCDTEQENASAAIRECAEIKLRCLEQIKVYADKLAEYEKPLEPLLEEQIYNDPVWLEMNAENDIPRIVDVIPSFVNPAERAEIAFIGQNRRAHLPYSHYGSSWRCWSRKPTEAERKAAKWDG